MKLFHSYVRRQHDADAVAAMGAKALAIPPAASFAKRFPEFEGCCMGKCARRAAPAGSPCARPFPAPLPPARPPPCDANQPACGHGLIRAALLAAGSRQTCRCGAPFFS